MDPSGISSLKSRARQLREIIILPDKQLRLVPNQSKKARREVAGSRRHVETMYRRAGNRAAALRWAAAAEAITMDFAKAGTNGEREQDAARVFINRKFCRRRKNSGLLRKACMSIPPPPGM